MYLCAHPEHRENSPSTVVYNQCANLVLKYAVKTHAGLQDEPVNDLKGEKVLPPPPKPEEIDCIIAGFPWYVLFLSKHIMKFELNFLVNLTPL